MDNFRLNKIVVRELEGLLIHLQKRIDYFHIQNEKKNSDLYEKNKEFIDEGFKDLKNMLE